MKPKTKIIAVVAFSLALAPLFAGGGQVSDEKNAVAERRDKTAVEKGLMLAAFMREKALNEAYLSAMVKNDGKLRKKIKEIAAGDVSEASAVYRVDENFEGIAIAMIFSEGFELSDIRPQIRFDIARNLMEGLPQSFTQKKSGELGTKAVTVLKTDRAFDSAEIIGDTMYIFTFKNAYPVAVIFMQNADNAVWAESFFVLDRDFTAGLEKSGLKLEKVR